MDKFKTIIEAIPHFEGEKTRKMCIQAEEVLRNSNLDSDTFDDYMMTIAYLYREAFSYEEE